MTTRLQRYRQYSPAEAAEGHVRLYAYVDYYLGDPDSKSTTMIAGTVRDRPPIAVSRRPLDGYYQMVIYDVPQHLVPEDFEIWEGDDDPPEWLRDHDVAFKFRMEWGPWTVWFASWSGVVAINFRDEFGRGTEPMTAEFIQALVTEMRSCGVVRGASLSETRKTIRKLEAQYQKVSDYVYLGGFMGPIPIRDYQASMGAVA